MVFVTGPLCSGKRTFAQKLGGRQVYDVQDLAADAADLNRLADERHLENCISDKQGTFTALPSTYEYGSADRIRAMTATGHERFSLW